MDSGISTTLISAALFFSIIFIVVYVRKKMRNSRSFCPNCKAQYEYPRDMCIFYSDLKWEAKTKTEYKGDFKYEIEYRLYYRIVEFVYRCPQCQTTNSFRKRYDVYRSDSKYSQSDEEEMELLNQKIRATFDESMFFGKFVKDCFSSQKTLERKQNMGILSFLGNLINNHSRCPSCKTQYTYPKNMRIYASDLKWEKNTKTEYKGDFKYEVEYRTFYRTVEFVFLCHNCNKIYSFKKRYDLYRSDSRYSQSYNEEISLLKEKIISTFDKSMFIERDIHINFSDEL